MTAILNWSGRKGSSLKCDTVLDGTCFSMYPMMS